MSVLGSSTSAGDVLQLIASGAACTRTAIARQTGLSRSSVSDRLEPLFDAQLITEASTGSSVRGRPSKVLSLNAGERTILAADVGEGHTRLALTDLHGDVLADEVAALVLTDGAGPVIEWIVTTAHSLLGSADRDIRNLMAVALSLPAPVDVVNGTVVGPSILASWDGVELKTLLHARLRVPVVIENDVNARGLGEYRARWSGYQDVLYVKAGTGIGSAIITGGQLLRGGSGAAGDIGHIRLDPETGPLCRCGALGCVEAYAAGWSIVRELSTLGFDVATTQEAVALAVSGEPQAIHLIRQAGQALGRAIAYAVSLLNPQLVIVSGSTSQNNDYLLAGIRHTVYQFSLPLATRDLRIVAGRNDPYDAIAGAVHLAREPALSPSQVNTYLQTLQVV